MSIIEHRSTEGRTGETAIFTGTVPDHGNIVIENLPIAYPVAIYENLRRGLGKTRTHTTLR